MLKLCRVTKLKLFFPVLVYVFNFDLFEFSAAILEKGLFEVNLRKISCRRSGSLDYKEFGHFAMLF